MCATRSSVLNIIVRSVSGLYKLEKTMKYLMMIMAGLVFVAGANSLEAQCSSGASNGHRTSSRSSSRGHSHVQYVNKRVDVWVAASIRIERRTVRIAAEYRMVNVTRYTHCGNPYVVRIRKFFPASCETRDIEVVVPGYWEVQIKRVAVRVNCHSDHSRTRSTRNTRNQPRCR